MSPRLPSGTALKSFATSHRELSLTTHHVQIFQEACRSSSPNTFVICWLLHPAAMGFTAEVAHLGLDVFADLLSVKMTASSKLCATTGVRLSVASSTILVTPSAASLVVTTFGNHLSLVINPDTNFAWYQRFLLTAPVLRNTSVVAALFLPSASTS